VVIVGISDIIEIAGNWVSESWVFTFDHWSVSNKGFLLWLKILSNGSVMTMSSHFIAVITSELVWWDLIWCASSDWWPWHNFLFGRLNLKLEKRFDILDWLFTLELNESFWDFIHWVSSYNVSVIVNSVYWLGLVAGHLIRCGLTWITSGDWWPFLM
jgi:hypothetical protein